MREKILQAIASLPQPQRDVTTLFYVNGYSQKDIGGFLGVPAGTVRSRLTRARRYLQKELLTMVENELKKTRPEKAFTEEVVRQITSTRVYVSGRRDNALMLTDDQKRSFTVFLDPYEAWALQQTEGPKDLFSALRRLLEGLGYRITCVHVGPGYMPNHQVRLTLQRGAGKPTDATAEFSGRFAWQLAVRMGGEILVDQGLAQKLAWKTDAKGQPLPPSKVWDHVQAYPEMHAYRNLQEVFKALERDPTDKQALDATCEIKGNKGFQTPLVVDVSEGMKQMQVWLKKVKGSTIEPLAWAILGSAYVKGRKEDAAKAIEAYEKAHTLAPEDTHIAFDLATAYVVAGETEKAWELLDRFQFAEATRCSNFEPLWSDHRFGEKFGEVDPRRRKVFRLLNTDREVVSDETLVEYPKHYEFEMSCPKGTKDIEKALASHTGAGVLRVQTVVGLVGSEQGRQWALMDTDSGTVGIHLPWWIEDTRVQDLEGVLRTPYETTPWVRSPQGVHDLLSTVNAEIRGMLLAGKDGEEIDGVVLVQQGKRRASTEINGIDAISLALEAKAPLLMAADLAEELIIRGAKGQPLTLPGARRKLCKLRSTRQGCTSAL